MSKRNKEQRLKLKAAQEARRLTVGKVLRLVLKMFVFAILASLVVSLATAAGVPGFERSWVPIVVMLLLYIPAYPIVMSEFRPKPPLKRGSK